MLARIEGEPLDLIERLAELVASDVLGHPRSTRSPSPCTSPRRLSGCRSATSRSPWRGAARRARRRRRRGEPASWAGSDPQDTARRRRRGARPAPRRHRRRRSPTLHDTEPVGGPDQPVYVNAVVTARTTLSPASLLRELHGIEAAFDRRREVRWGARTLDLDLVQYGDPDADTDVTVRPAAPHPAAPASARAGLRARAVARGRPRRRAAPRRAGPCGRRPRHHRRHDVACEPI